MRDGQPPVLVKTTAPQFAYQVPTVIATGLAAKNHSVVLQCLVSICAVDYFLISSC